jgi:hypothetical protein
MEFDHVEPHRDDVPGILPGSVAGNAQVRPLSVRPNEAEQSVAAGM